MSNLDDESVTPTKKLIEQKIRDTILNVEKVFFKLETHNGTLVSEKLKQDKEKRTTSFEKKRTSTRMEDLPSNRIRTGSDCHRMRGRREAEAAAEGAVEEEGIEIDVNVKVKNGDRNRLLNMAIECPQFYPKRIQFDGKWHNIV